MNKKYFIAIIPPENVFKKIESIKQELFTAHGLKGALRSPAHITLHRPFEWKTEKENELIQTLGQFMFERRFVIELKNYNCFRPRIIFVDVKKSGDLNDLHLKLSGYARRQLGLFNEAEDMRGFKPHVTVAFRDLKKQLFYKLWEGYEKAEFEENFDFTGFCLLRLETKWEIIHEFSI